MQAWTIMGHGPHDLDDVRQLEIATPTPRAGELLIKVGSVGLNPADYKVIENGTWNDPHVVGMDAAGIVAGLGSGVTGFTVGDRVLYHGDLRRAGSLATYTITTSQSVAHLPATVSLDSAAASLCGTLTAYQALHRKANLTAAKSVLIHAGGGAVGLAALQFAHQLGLRTIATTSDRKRALVERVGADVIINYHQADVTQAVLAATKGRGVDVSLNTLGGESLAEDTARMAYNGQIIAIGDGMPDHFDFDTRSLSLSRSGLGGVYRSEDPAGIHDLAIMATAVGKQLASGALDPVIGATLSFNQAVTGLKHLKHGENLGKLVVHVDSSLE
ncbi:zinc-binding dehydrogenase [Levilactobacillus huananensis]|uniref:zinc-binding dehydrogenase n=1 Tax=Levilactobacillus huananensis TaxID=2486019 RepID=UPI000F76FEC0|nr:zinc-binding dehydrogenase [Levilactobacillus huananensis]